MKIVLTDTFCVIWLMLNIYIIHGELDWVVNGRVTGYGDNVTLFCLVDDCCKKAAGWIKFDPHYTTIYLDVRDFKHKTSKKDKYAATTNSTGFGLVIKNVRQDDFNIKYLCSYGFEKSSEKVLYQSDVFKVDEPDEPQSKLLLAVIVIGSITAVVILLVAIVLIVRWRRNQNLKQNENSSESRTLELEKQERNQNNIMKSEDNTTTKTVTSLTETVDELYKDDQISQSERLLQNDEPSNITNMHGKRENESKE